MNRTYTPRLADPRGRIAAAVMKWLRIEPTTDVHAVYRFMRRLRVGGQRIGVARSPTTSYHVYWPKYPKRILLPIFNHAAILVQVLTEAAAGRKVIVREFDALLVLLLAPVLWWFRKRLLLNVNTEFFLPLGAGLDGAAMRGLVALGFGFLWFDGDVAQSEVRAAFPGIRLVTPLFPIVGGIGSETAGQDARRNAFVVGFVGSFQAAKGGMERLRVAMAQVAQVPGVAVRIGFWNEGQRLEFARTKPDNVEAVSTFRPEEYHAFLAGCDAVVMLAERDAYFYRHSGVVIDCIANRTIPIVPDYPLLASLARRPLPIGGVYDSLDDLPAVVQELQARRRELEDAFGPHRAGRSPEQVSAALEAYFQPVR